MEEQQLSQLEELAKAATPGPWMHSSDGGFDDPHYVAQFPGYGF